MNPTPFFLYPYREKNYGLAPAPGPRIARRLGCGIFFAIRDNAIPLIFFHKRTNFVGKRAASWQACDKCVP
jgi:hypothetical protein